MADRIFQRFGQSGEFVPTNSHRNNTPDTAILNLTPAQDELLKRIQGTPKYTPPGKLKRLNNYRG